MRRWVRSPSGTSGRVPLSPAVPEAVPADARLYRRSVPVPVRDSYDRDRSKPRFVPSVDRKLDLTRRMGDIRWRDEWAILGDYWRGCICGVDVRRSDNARNWIIS